MLIAVAFGIAPAGAAEFPPRLVGNSMIVKWTAARQTRDGGRVYDNRTNFEINVYISTSGRTFSRWYVSGYGGKAIQTKLRMKVPARKD